MRCTNRRSRSRRYKTRRRKQIFTRIILFVVILAMVCGLAFLATNLLSKQNSVVNYETENYTSGLFKGTLFSEHLCVTSENIIYDEFKTEDTFKASALFNLDDKSVLMAENIHEKIYPASTTKLMTFYLAMKYGNLDDIVTISETATILPSGSSRAWLKVGDSMSLKDLLYSMMLASGNDSAIAISEYISGSETEFAELMNKEAALLGATNTHFVNSHGYHDENHYTTAYDLYIIMDACLKYDAFVELISTSKYNTAITEPNGYQRKVEWVQTNFFLNGMATVPEGVTIIGGKTGTTDAAGDCLMLYCKDKDQVPYLAIIMGAESREKLYDNMSSLISTLQ